MCGGSKTQTASSGQGGIPPELQPLIGGSVDQTLGIQASNPLSSYVGPNPQQIQGLSGSEGDFLQGIMGLSQMGYTGPESGAWRALEGVQSNPLGFNGASSPEGTYTMPEMGALQELISGLNAPIGSSPVTLQAMKAWQQNVAPQVRNQQALQGTLYGGAADEAIANSASSAMVPLIQQEMQSRAAAIPQLMQLGGTAANRFRGDTQQEISNLMSTVGPLMELGGTGANRYRSDLQQGLTAASVPRDIANQQNQAEFQDYMRRYGMSQQATLGPLMEVLPNLLSQVQTSTTKGSGGGMFGSLICTELHRQGLMDEETYKADCDFGASLPPQVIAGYHRWARPVAEAMRRSKTITTLVAPIALLWAKEMRYPGKGSIIGRALLKVGIPFCGWLGKGRRECDCIPDPTNDTDWIPGKQCLLEPQEFRRQIINLQDRMVQKIKEGVLAPKTLPVMHYFTPIDQKYGCCAYGRVVLIEKGNLSIGKIHKHSHLNFIMKGKISVETEFGRKYYEAPCIFVSEPGLKRAVLAIEDTIWATVHLTEHRGEGNLDKIEDEVIAKTYEELDDLGNAHSSSRSGR